ncbi:uncharacterized protein LOC115009442 [Cottoperca gobio]|uniref:exodeoxyribonuclease III n=1 Tax=Cottoperca gobio TaxID=56716 RepID=A0A6J2PW19_COTGO|nr:uncharacterized protein LOC115009442 [Cottoperca gobio]
MIVFFDLETTGLDTKVCDIIQLSAIHEDRDFNVYILPSRPIHERASEVNGFTVGDGRLLLNGTPVDTVPLVDALTSFIDFLRSFQRPVLLAAHNAEQFDAPLLQRVLRQFSLYTEFQQVVSGTSWERPTTPMMHWRTASILQELFNSWSPSNESIKLSTMSGDEMIVFFDLETTGLDTKVCDIIQLSAIHEDRDFNVYILPSRPIHERASEVNGFTVGDGRLLLNGTPVDTVPLVDALTSFIDFLRSFQRPVLLAAHNAEQFDAPLLQRVLRQFSLYTEFQQVVSGFVDTLPLSRNLHPDLPSYSQVNLVQHFLGKTYNAHDALEDARMLQELFNSWSPSNESIKLSTMSGDEMIVFFDLETTGLDTKVCDIIQLSAIHEDRDFNVYILPSRPIHERASEVNGFTVGDGRLLLNGTPVDTVPLVDALTSFIDFLRSFQRPVLLAAHNARAV